MSVVEIRAEFAALKTGEEHFARALRDLESELESLEKELERSLAQWEGPAQKAYLAARTAWDQSARDLHAELGRLHQAIVRAHRNYRNALDANMRMWSP